MGKREQSPLPPEQQEQEKHPDGYNDVYAILYENRGGSHTREAIVKQLRKFARTGKKSEIEGFLFEDWSVEDAKKLLKEYEADLLHQLSLLNNF